MLASCLSRWVYLHTDVEYAHPAKLSNFTGVSELVGSGGKGVRVVVTVDVINVDISPAILLRRSNCSAQVSQIRSTWDWLCQVWRCTRQGWLWTTSSQKMRRCNCGWHHSRIHVQQQIAQSAKLSLWWQSWISFEPEWNRGDLGWIHLDWNIL